MSVFSVPVTIGVDEEKIAKEIENDVKNQVINKITEEVKKTIYRTNYYGKIDERDNLPLKEIVSEEVHKVITNKESEIVELAAKYLAEKMAKTKAVKEAIKAVVEEFEN